MPTRTVSLFVALTAGACATTGVPSIPAGYESVQPELLCTVEGPLATPITTQAVLDTVCPGKTIDFGRATLMITGGEDRNRGGTETLWWAVDSRTQTLLLGQRHSEACVGGVQMPPTPIVVYAVPGKISKTETKVEVVPLEKPCGPPPP